MRDGHTLYFRAYIEGLSETVSPSWNSEAYVGRSEPVYTYTNSEREINFSLKLFAGTKDELNAIYRKMNRLTSMCYPEYKIDYAMGDTSNDSDNDANANNEPVSETDLPYSSGLWTRGTARSRMKPPFTKIRLGDLYGVETAITRAGKGKKAEMHGFIKSLSYTFPDESPWEIQDGYIVPKYIQVELGYQVVHSDVPSLDFAKENGGSTFYGINQTSGVGVVKALTQQNGTNND